MAGQEGTVRPGGRWLTEVGVAALVVAGLASGPALALLLVIVARRLWGLPYGPMPNALWLGCWVGAALADWAVFAILRRHSPDGAEAFAASAALTGLPLLFFMLVAATGFGPPD